MRQDALLLTERCIGPHGSCSNRSEKNRELWEDIEDVLVTVPDFFQIDLNSYPAALCIGHIPDTRHGVIVLEVALAVAAGPSIMHAPAADRVPRVPGRSRSGGCRRGQSLLRTRCATAPKWPDRKRRKSLPTARRTQRPYVPGRNRCPRTAMPC